MHGPTVRPVVGSDGGDQCVFRRLLAATVDFFEQRHVVAQEWPWQGIGPCVGWSDGPALPSPMIVSGSDRGDCEGFLTFPRWRANRYSSGLLVACVILILCWLCGTLLRVWHVIPISA